MRTREKQLEAILEAIKARIIGEWDNRELLSFGPLTCDTQNDILTMVETILPKG